MQPRQDGGLHFISDSIDVFMDVSSKESRQMRKKIREGAALGVLLSFVLYGG